MASNQYYITRCPETLVGHRTRILKKKVAVDSVGPPLQCLMMQSCHVSSKTGMSCEFGRVAGLASRINIQHKDSLISLINVKKWQCRHIGTDVRQYAKQWFTQHWWEEPLKSPTYVQRSCKRSPCWKAPHQHGSGTSHHTRPQIRSVPRCFLERNMPRSVSGGWKRNVKFGQVKSKTPSRGEGQMPRM